MRRDQDYDDNCDPYDDWGFYIDINPSINHHHGSHGTQAHPSMDRHSPGVGGFGEGHGKDKENDDDDNCNCKCKGCDCDDCDCDCDCDD